MKINKEIHYFYRIDNLKNGKFYYGIRTCHCLPGQDPYMGSGRHLSNAIKLYGVKYFKKTILRVSPTRDDVSDLERWIVTEELVKDPMCYNQRVGGDDHDSFYGKVNVFDVVTGRSCSISKDEYYSNKDRYRIHGNFGKVALVWDKDGNKISVTWEEFWNNKSEYVLRNKTKKGVITLKDVNGNIVHTNINDPKYLSGELVPIFTGLKHTDETKNKMSKKAIGRTGDKASHWGHKWMTDPTKSFSKTIASDQIDLYLSMNWTFGRINVIKNSDKVSELSKGRKWVNNGFNEKLVKGDKLTELLNLNWSYGRLQK